MKTKICRKCKVEKPLDSFYKEKTGKDGHRNICGVCECERSKKYQKEHSHQVLEKNRKWVRENKEYVTKRNSDRYQLIEKSERKIKYKTNEEFRNAYIKSSHNYRHNPKNKEILKKFRKTFKEKHKNDPRYKTVNNLRRRLKHLLDGTQKSEHTLTIIGCSRTELVAYLQSKFKIGMNWNNYGFRGWHIDHIIPCSTFDFTKLEEQKKCFHYTNLQPLWWYENLKKGNRLIKNWSGGTA